MARSCLYPATSKLRADLAAVHVAAATVDFIFSLSAAFSAFICASSAVFFASQSRCATFKSSSISPTVRRRTTVRSTFCCASGSNPSSRSSSSNIALRSASHIRSAMAAGSPRDPARGRDSRIGSEKRPAAPLTGLWRRGFRVGVGLPLEGGISLEAGSGVDTLLSAFGARTRSGAGVSSASSPRASAPE
ncbi:hypothetical protein M885DRAFT_526960 [Pelagophyceae sp. CCMP2097]|nr:hypothetical protein M885DRAFT_526960 [Pelagophyceae sp. CCMP2097]